MIAIGIIGLILLAGILVVGIFNWQRNSSIARKLDRMEGLETEVVEIRKWFDEGFRSGFPKR